MKRRLLVALAFCAAGSAARAQIGSTGVEQQAAKPPERRSDATDLQPEPEPVKVQEGAIKLPEKQFEIPPSPDDIPLTTTPQPDEPPPPDEPPKKAAKQKKKR